MPTLLDTIEISQMAFKWDNMLRVYQTDRLTVSSEQDGEEWQYSNNRWGQVIECIWLFFQIESNYLQRLAPASESDNDWLDVRDAIKDPSVDVHFYPVYSVDPTISYHVISNEIGERVPLLVTDRAIFQPSVALNIKPADSVKKYPAWLRITRYKPTRSQFTAVWDEGSGDTSVTLINQ